MPMDKYKSFYEIVKMLINFDLTKLRSIEKEIKILTKVKSKRKKVKKNKKVSGAQKRARAKFAMRVRRGDFR